MASGAGTWIDSSHGFPLTWCMQPNVLGTTVSLEHTYFTCPRSHTCRTIPAHFIDSASNQVLAMKLCDRQCLTSDEATCKCQRMSKIIGWTWLYKRFLFNMTQEPHPCKWHERNTLKLKLHRPSVLPRKKNEMERWRPSALLSQWFEKLSESSELVSFREPYHTLTHIGKLVKYGCKDAFILKQRRPKVVKLGKCDMFKQI